MSIKDYQSSHLRGTTYMYRIDLSTDIKEVVSDHIRFMETVGFLFFDNLSSLEKIDQFYNSKLMEGSYKEFNEKLMDTLESNKLRNFFSVIGAQYGLVTAYLLDKKNKEEIVYRYSKLYLAFPVYNDFEKLIRFLETNSNKLNIY